MLGLQRKVIGLAVRDVHSIGEEVPFANGHFMSNVIRAKTEVWPGAIVIKEVHSALPGSVEKSSLEEVMLKQLYFEG